MRVLFIFPNLNAEEGFNHGIAALSGGLRAHGHETGLLNLNESLYRIPEIEELVDIVAGWSPDFIAFSVMSQQYPYALELGRNIKQRLPGSPIGIGGVHTIMCTDEVVGEGFWDFIGVGECDEALPELIDRLADQDPRAREVPNFCVRLDDGTYRRNPLAAYPDLSKLPPKDYDIFNLSHMLERKNSWQSILTSRGCPYRCTYCFNHEVTDRYRDDGHTRKSFLRHYPVERIIGELEDLKNRYPIETFIFDDDLFTLNRDYCVRFLEAYVNAGLETPFVLNSHVQTFNETIAGALAAAPCMIVKFGVESGSPRLRREVLQRYMSNEQIVDAFQLCHDHGLHTSAFLMFGLPHETRAEMEKTIDLLARIKPGRMRWSIFYPFPGTKSFEICRRGNLIDPDRIANLTNFFCASCLKFDAETDLFIRKLQRTFHWWVNARAGYHLSPDYQQRVEEIERVTLSDWHELSDQILDMDREASDGYLRRSGRSGPEVVQHYSIRYTEVMAVGSDFILAETGSYKDRAARRWKAFRDQIRPSGAEGGIESSPRSLDLALKVRVSGSGPEWRAKILP